MEALVMAGHNTWADHKQVEDSDHREGSDGVLNDALQLRHVPGRQPQAPRLNEALLSLGAEELIDQQAVGEHDPTRGKQQERVRVTKITVTLRRAALRTESKVYDVHGLCMNRSALTRPSDPRRRISP